jgi:hypothetical protein
MQIIRNSFALFYDEKVMVQLSPQPLKTHGTSVGVVVTALIVPAVPAENLVTIVSKKLATSVRILEIVVIVNL